jgi:hypothetical protein
MYERLADTAHPPNGYWMHEPLGRLRQAVGAYLAGRAINDGHAAKATMTAAACNLVRLPKLLASAA